VKEIECAPDAMTVFHVSCCLLETYVTVKGDDDAEDGEELELFGYLKVLDRLIDLIPYLGEKIKKNQG
jgi:hypothetical protein